MSDEEVVMLLRFQRESQILRKEYRKSFFPRKETNWHQNSFDTMEWKTLFFSFSEAIVSFSEAFFQELSHFGLLNLSLIRGFISLVKKEFFF